ncbi:YjbF family lipoprotein [Seohaeicola saemankumensis]|nr:YjbF family lipoprotein [Seohaeicola saemankumensis]MCA0873452.1 YjbF family lipoprotein [Seohaeicola saemankumensis]
MTRKDAVARPMMHRARVCAALLAGVLLAGCGGGNQVEPLELQVIRAGQAAIAKRTAGAPPPRPALTRAALNTVEVSALEVTLERDDVLAYLLIDDTRRDSTPGRITVWRSEDNLNVVTRNGIVIATRGLGNDIISSSVQVSGDSPGPARSGDHVQMVRALDNKAVPIPLACDLVDMGAETIVIVERKHPTRHLQQRCEGAGGTVVNDYWVDSARGIVWQSRQWAGPGIGYMRLRRLTTG